MGVIFPYGNSDKITMGKDNCVAVEGRPPRITYEKWKEMMAV